MKFLITILICLGLHHFAGGAEAARQVTKTSEKRFQVEHEIIQFYLHLLKSDAVVKAKFDSLTARLRDEEMGGFFAFDPRVVPWFPSESRWEVSTGFDSDARYLVIQPIGSGGGKHASHDAAVVSEFRVVHRGTTSYTAEDERNSVPQAKIISNTLTITFLGFRSPDLNRLKLSKSPNR